MADGLSPYIDAAPLEEQKYFLATQQVDEARHAVFFKRFMDEVAGIGGTMNDALEAIRPQLTWGFVQVFDMLERMSEELRHDRSIPKLAQAITLYHVIIEATLAQPGQHFITSYLDKRDVLPALPRRHAQDRGGRAAPHRLRREDARRPQGRWTTRCRPRSPTSCAR